MTTKRKRWDDQSFWEHISVGYCTACGEGHVLKDGLCWTHRPERTILDTPPTTTEATR